MEEVSFVGPSVSNGLVIETPYVIAALAGAGSVIAYLFFALVGAKDRQLAEQEKAALMRESNLNKQIADLQAAKVAISTVAREAISAALETANQYLRRDGRPAVHIPPRIELDAASAGTEAQRDLASMASARATIALIRAETGQTQISASAPAKDHPDPISSDYEQSTLRGDSTPPRPPLDSGGSGG